MPPPGARPVDKLLTLERVTHLTDGQRDCLRLVYNHMTSKDIARELGVSPHTVDMRLRTAMRTLAVDSRIDAARLLIQTEGETAATATYQPLIYQSPDVAGGGFGATVGAPASTESDENAIRNADPRIRPVVGPPASGPPRLAGASSPQHPNAQHSRAPSLSYPTGASIPAEWSGSWSGSLPWGPRNDLGIGARFAWIALIAIGSALGFGAILGALEALKRLL